MPLTQDTNLTLLDIAKRTDPNGNIADIVELLAEDNEWMLDATAVEANDGHGHKTTVRTGLPSGTWRKLYGGVQPEKSETAEIRDTTGMLETYSEPDKALIDMSPNPQAARFSEDRAFLEGMSQTVSDTLIYGDTSVNPERFLGLAPRFSDISAENGDNMLNGGAVAGQSDCFSIYLVGWGETGTHLIYPRGSQAGITARDLGEDTVTKADGSKYQCYRTHYKHDIGLVMRDWRRVCRIHSIDSSTLTKDAASGADLIDLMVQASEVIRDSGALRFSWLVNRTAKSFLRRQITNRDNVWLSMEEVAGKPTLMFDGKPVRRCDALTKTETSLTV